MFSKIVLALALGVSAVSATLYTSHEESQKYMWDNFKKEFGKSYDLKEDVERFQIFVQNLKVIDERNAKEQEAGGSAVHGITKFSDLSQDEFASRYLTTYTTAVKDQGYCGSCWAFSVAEQVESDAMRTLGTNYILAPQQLVSCDSSDSGCNGGWPTTAYDYIESAGGLVQESDYPYTSGTAGVTGSCVSSDLSDKVLTVSKYYTLSSESDMAAHMVSTGPIAIALDASSWSSYTGGIMSSCGSSVDHAVQAVGIDTSAGYWKVRNSWGTSWGESGYIRLAYGSDTCALTTIPTYVDAASA